MRISQSATSFLISSLMLLAKSHIQRAGIPSGRMGKWDIATNPDKARQLTLIQMRLIEKRRTTSEKYPETCFSTIKSYCGINSQALIIQPGRYSIAKNRG
jgi:hypothetical protein